MQPGEQRLDRVEHHAFRADGVDGVPEPQEEPFQVILARLLDLAALDVDIIEHDFFLCRELAQIEAERADIGLEFGRVFLEHHEHARLAKLRRPAHQEFHGEHGLSGPRTATYEGRPARRQPAAGDFIEALNAGGRFGQPGAGRIAVRLQSRRLRGQKLLPIVATVTWPMTRRVDRCETRLSAARWRQILFGLPFGVTYFASRLEHEPAAGDSILFLPLRGTRIHAFPVSRDSALARALRHRPARSAFAAHEHRDSDRSLVAGEHNFRRRSVVHDIEHRDDAGDEEIYIILRTAGFVDGKPERHSHQIQMSRRSQLAAGNAARRWFCLGARGRADRGSIFSIGKPLLNGCSSVTYRCDRVRIILRRSRLVCVPPNIATCNRCG